MRKIYVYDDPVRESTVGKYICPICGQNSSVTERKNKGFKALLSDCPNSHRVLLHKEVYQKYRIGDQVRIYDTTFGKDSVIKPNWYTEGIIIASYEGITDYEFDMRITEVVCGGEKIPETSWLYGHILKSHKHHRNDVKLIKRAELEYHQLKLKLT